MLSLLLLPFLSSVNAQCGDALDSSQALAHATSIAGLFPVPLTTAKIVSGDSEAQKIYDAILANETYKSALAIAPKTETMEYPATDPDCWWSRGGCVTPKQSYLSSDHHHCTQKGTWGLTFDDGPTCASATLYGILEKEKLKASLYFIGGNVLQFPGQAQAAVEAGHEICGHTWSHQMTTTLSNEEVFAEMYYTTKAIKAITGIQTKCFRPSYGDVDDRVRTIGHALGLRIDLWSDDTFDWELTIKGKKVIDANYAAIFAKASAAEGVTVLTHETSNVTVGQFQNRFPLAKKAFNVFAPVGTCLGIQQYYVQDNLTFPTYEQYVSGSIEPSTQWRSFLSEGTLDIPLQAVSDATETKSSASATATTEGSKETSKSESGNGGQSSAASQTEQGTDNSAASRLGVVGLSAVVMLLGALWN